MQILQTFLIFLENIMNFEILGIPVYGYLITTTLFALIFEFIKSLANK